jgi:hypothetical protein
MIKINKKLLLRVSAAVIIAILALWVARAHNEWYGKSHLIDSVISSALSILAFPVRLYLMFGWDDPLPILGLLIVVSGVFWGALVERIVWVLQRPRATGA